MLFAQRAQRFAVAGNSNSNQFAPSQRCPDHEAAHWVIVPLYPKKVGWNASRGSGSPLRRTGQGPTWGLRGLSRGSNLSGRQSLRDWSLLRVIGRHGGGSVRSALPKNRGIVGQYVPWCEKSLVLVAGGHLSRDCSRCVNGCQSQGEHRGPLMKKRERQRGHR